MFVTHLEIYVFGVSEEECSAADEIEKAWKNADLEVTRKESTTQILLSYKTIRKYGS